MSKNTSIIDPARDRILKNNQYAIVSKNEAYQLATTVQEMFSANGIPYEVEQAVYKERSPEFSVKVSPTGISFRLGFSCKTATVTRFTPKGGIFDEY